jgi:hypothetical protein
MNSRPACPAYELRFPSLFNEGRAFSFPCDDHGRVDLDRLGELARHNYLYARATIGRNFGWPLLCPPVSH